MSAKLLSVALVLATAYAVPGSDLVNKDGCTPCSPSGSTGLNPPAVGSDLAPLYTDVLGSVKDIHFSKRWLDPVEKRKGGLCCAPSTDCVNVQNLNIPMCYDKFTTNFAFTDGSYGSLTTGEYNAADGSQANLLQGNYTAGGQSGNIYGSDSAAKPNTATLSVPPQWTGTGVGSAIPVSQLGSVVVYTTTIPAQTITGATTLFSTGSSTTKAVSTVTAPTTLAATTNVVTSTPGAKSKGAAGQLQVDSNTSLGMSLFTALMYAIYAL